MDFRVFESALGSNGVISCLLSRHYNLEINISHISYTIIFYPFLFHFYSSCPDQPEIRKQERDSHGFSTPGPNAVHGF